MSEDARRERETRLLAELPFLAKGIRRARARRLARAESQLKYDLIQARIDRAMSQEDVAAILGVTQATVSRFEDIDNDPKLSTIIRYANAIGANLSLNVEPDDPMPPTTSARGEVAFRPVKLGHASTPHASWATSGRQYEMVTL